MTITALGIGPLKWRDVLIAATSPNVGFVNVYNTTTAGTPLEMTLPHAAALGAAGAMLFLQKDLADTTNNLITFTCYSGEHFTDGTTVKSLVISGESMLLQAIDVGGVIQWQVWSESGQKPVVSLSVLDYGADPSGILDSTEAFQSAIAALPEVGGSDHEPTGGGWVYAPTGKYKISETLDVTQFQNLRGDGKYLTQLIYTGTGPCISATNTENPTGLPTPCNFEGFSIDGVSSGTGAIGLQIGNLFHSIGRDLMIQNFTTTGGIGLLFMNYGDIPVADRMHWTVDLMNNASGVVFDGNCGPGEGSFSYGKYEFSIVANVNQKVVTMQNNALIGRSRFSVIGNCTTTSASNSAWVIGMDVGAPTDRSQFTDCEFLIGVECMGNDGFLGPRSLQLESTNLGGITGHGEMAFIDTFDLDLSGHIQSFQGAAIATGSIFAVSGRITDPVLGKMSFNDCANFQGGTQRNAFLVGSGSFASPSELLPQFGDVQEFQLPNTSASFTGFLNEPFTASRRLEILLRQPASGAPCVVTWPSNIKWANGNSVLSRVNSAVDKVVLTYFPDDDTWYGELTNAAAARSTSTVTAGGVTTLTYGSTPTQIFTGSSAQSVLLPSTGVIAGKQYTIVNQSSNGVLVYSSTTDLIGGVAPGLTGVFTALANDPTAATGWSGVISAGGTTATFPGSATPTASALAQWDASKNLSANVFLKGTTSTATAAGTTTLTIASAQVQVFTGSTTQTVKLPTTSVPAGQAYTIVNQSSGVVTVQSSGANTIATLPANTQATFVSQKATPTAQADWVIQGRASTVVEYTTTQSSVTVPVGVTGVWVESLIQAGHGGGSGRRGAAGSVRCGGGGGGSGAVINNQFVPAALLGSTFDVTLPAAGSGGAAVTADNTNGNAGGVAGAASFTSGSYTLSTIGGTAAAGGTNAAGAGGTGGLGPLSGAAGGAASATGGAGAGGGATVNGAPSAGGAGGGITSGDSASAGGAGGIQTLQYGVTAAAGGVVGGSSPGTGSAAMAGVGGLGGGGGAASTSTAAQAGATPTGYGAGGGGGGSSVNGNNSGKGGDGGPAYCRLRWMYV